ncbi:endonuclease MutS2 [candidate division KSB1 bacterium]|nr:endonuclease MutS2 [candidate division KSB1 bacterium]
MESVLQACEFDRIREKLSLCAISPLGKERALNLEPQQELTAIKQQLVQTSEMLDLLKYEQAIPVGGILDIRAELKKVKIEASVLRPDEIARISQLLAAVRHLSFYFNERLEKIPTLVKVTKNLLPLQNIEKEINRCIDLKNHEIKDSASERLAQIRAEIIRVQEAARRKIEKLLKSLSSQGVLQENLITIRDGRLVLMVKEEYKKKVKGLVVDESSSGSTLFIEPIASLEDNNRIRHLQVEEAKEIERILYRLSAIVRADNDVIRQNVDCLAVLDFIYAKAALARDMQGNLPEIVDQEILSIAGGRHPLLVLRIGHNNVIPIDVTLGREFHTLIVSGPNAGGKTVALKTIGLLTLMVQSGLLIPVLPHSKFGRISQVFASIGDEQSIENDLSTFSSHLENLKSIIENSASTSLVLIDEIGSGTDPAEGAALAMALLEHLTRKKCLTVVTTHLGELKAFAFQTEDVENGSMEFDPRSLKPTYAFRVGIPGSSYAFEIAARMALDTELIKRAKQLVGSQKEKLEELIILLNQKIYQHASLVNEANIHETELRGLKNLYKERTENFKREEKSLKKKAVDDAKSIVKEANALVERVVKDIRENQAHSQIIKKAHQELENYKKNISRMEESVILPEPKIDMPLAVGDFVLWEKVGQVGEVMSLPDNQGRIYIQVEGKKLRVPLEEVKKTTAPKKQKTVRINVTQPELYSDEIDVRGMRAEEAQETVDRFIDQVLMAGLTQVRIIHGKGTGKLRTALDKYLHTHPSVKKTRLGHWNEGNTGVTIVEFIDRE